MFQFTLKMHKLYLLASCLLNFLACKFSFRVVRPCNFSIFSLPVPPPRDQMAGSFVPPVKKLLLSGSHCIDTWHECILSQDPCDNVPAEADFVKPNHILTIELAAFQNSF